MPMKDHIRLRWEEGSETSEERMWEAVPYTFALQFRLPNFLEPPPSACGTLSVWDDNSSSFAGCLPRWPVAPWAAARRSRCSGVSLMPLSEQWGLCLRKPMARGDLCRGTSCHRPHLLPVAEGCQSFTANLEPTGSTAECQELLVGRPRFPDVEVESRIMA